MPPRDNPSQRRPSTSLQHANSTKRLIDRYESLNHGNPRMPLEPPSELKRPVKRASRIFSGISLKDKAGAPIRESFRNLWSVLKKAKTNVKDKDDKLSMPDSADFEVEGRHSASLSPRGHQRRIKMRTGSLMYLSYTSGSQLCWVRCQTTLAPDHLLLSINSEQGGPEQLQIYLSECSDVRSLTLKQLDPHVRGLLPYEGHPDDIKPFELSFDGRRGEKFIAESVQGRAQWVGAIWDTILRLQENEKQLLQRTNSIISATDYVAKPRLTQRKVVASTERSLPPAPPPKDSLPPLPLETSPSASIYPTSREGSRDYLGSPPAPCPKDPSPPTSDLISGLPTQLQPIQREQSSTADSILDAYGDALDALEGTQNNNLRPPAPVRYQLYDPPLPPIPKRSSYISVHSENEQPEDHDISSSPAVKPQDVPPLSINKASVPNAEPLSIDPVIRQDIEVISRTTLQVQDTVSSVQEQLSANIPVIMSKLEGLKSTLLAHQKKIQSQGPQQENINTSQSDARDLGEKLDHLLAIVSQTTVSNEGKQDLDAIANEVKLLKVMLQSSDQKILAQGTQAADSARYLNDLNKWLEIFVNQGISQIKNVMTNVQYLNHALGVNTKEKEPRSVAIHELHQLLVQSSTNPNTGVMQTAVDSLIAHLNSHSQASVMRTQEVMGGLIEQQRHTQETLLRKLTEELSSEIRGERLRFVEAMKEATQINVQVHVEQFKKELTKEVRELTQEVGRLHQERQNVESQIADLFAFYQKQTKSSSIPHISMVPGQVMVNPHPPLQAVQNLSIHHGFN